FLLTSETKADRISAHHRLVQTSVIQLVDKVAEQELVWLRQEMPGVKLVQVIHVMDSGALDQALGASHFVDALLLDSGNTNMAVKELGGTGRTHNWLISKQIVEESPKPVFLAGGLNPEIVREAIQVVKPFGVDVCSGLRRNGQLDPSRLEAFIEAIS
ncbi:MAG: phosphoribosylanthranilate isomerase, partial [Saprospiraceae bacterium]|nr:phosphoribosylanthranilate isomerase [Saprospiraceae bacterium]